MLIDLIRASVHDAIQERYPDVPVGCVLSGGIDSSTVTVLAHEFYATHGDTLPTFTGYYRGLRYDERPWAMLVGGLEHHEIEITPQDFIDNIDAVIRVVGGAKVGPGIFGQYMVAKYASQHVSVVLSGEGGDELFGGYARLAMVAGARVPDGYDDYQLPDDYPRTVEAALRYDLAGLPGLLAVDAMATAPFGLRSVAPMTDIRVVAYALSRPAMERVGKRLLRNAARGLVPDAIIDRTSKMGFPVPFVEWANGPLEEFVRDRIGYTPDINKPWDRAWWYDLTGAHSPDSVAA